MGRVFIAYKFSDIKFFFPLIIERAPTWFVREMAKTLGEVWFMYKNQDKRIRNLMGQYLSLLNHPTPRVGRPSLFSGDVIALRDGEDFVIFRTLNTGFEDEDGTLYRFVFDVLASEHAPIGLRPVLLTRRRNVEVKSVWSSWL